MYQHIRDIREDHDLSQKQMAELLNIGQTTYSDYELGKINIPIEISTKKEAKPAVEQKKTIAIEG